MKKTIPDLLSDLAGLPRKFAYLMLSMALSGAALAQVTVDVGAAESGSVDFGRVLIGRAESITITLVSTDTIKFRAETISVAAPFEIANNTCSTNGVWITPQAGCAITLLFRPTTVATHSSFIRIPVESPATHPGVFVNLAGIGSAVGIAPILTLDTPLMNFGDVYVGQSRQLTVGMSNRGGTALAATLTTTGTGFSVVNSNCVVGNAFSLAVGETCTLTATFSPLVIGSQSGSIRFGGAGAENIEIILKGRGRASTANVTMGGIVASPSSLAFGSVMVGSTARQTLRFTTGSGTRPAIVSALAPAGFVLDTNCAALSTESCDLDLTFAPTAVANYEGLVVVSTADGSTVFVTVAGQGGQGAQMSARSSGTNEALDLTGLATAHAQNTGRLYVAAWYANNLYFLAGGRWTQFVPGVEPPFYATANEGLNELTIINGQDVQPIAGAVIFLGYGGSLDEMVRNRQYTPIYVIN